VVAAGTVPGKPSALAVAIAASHPAANRANCASELAPDSTATRQRADNGPSR